MAGKIVILFGTVSGTSELVADEISESDLVESSDRIVNVVPMAKAELNVFNDTNARYLIVTSSYGKGEIPEKAQRFFDEIDCNRPDLSQIRYGVICLGDTKYSQTFCGAAKSFDRKLLELGAERIGEMCRIDASSGDFPEDVALEWFEQWIGCHK